MRKVGNNRYPETASEIVKDRALCQVLFNFCKSELNEENLLFIMSPIKPETLYLNFLKDNSRYMLNIPGDLRSRADILGAHDLWADPRWAGIISDARSECMRMLNFDILPRFWRSESFLDYHEQNGGGRLDAQAASTPAERAAERFDITNVDLLAAYIQKFEADGEDETLVAGTKLLRSEGIKMRVPDFNAELIKSGYMRKPEPKPRPSPKEETSPPSSIINLDLRKLKDCGFDDVGGISFQDRCREMIRHYLNDDNQKASDVYEKILKGEPKDSKLKLVKFADLMRLLKKKDAYKELENETYEKLADED